LESHTAVLEARTVTWTPFASLPLRQERSPDGIDANEEIVFEIPGVHERKHSPAIEAGVGEDPFTMRWLAGVFLRSLIVFAVLEGALWTLAATGAISLPSSIPLDNWDKAVINSNAGTNQRLYEPDRWTLTRLRADADITYPRNPIFPGGPKNYRVRTNAFGMRDGDVSREKQAGVLRIACLGDSSTFGYNVEQDETYPRRLQALLDAEYPGKFQVLNFGIPGHTSLHGVETLKHRALAFHPDVVTFAFGTNDRFWHGPVTTGERLRFMHSWAGAALSELTRVLNLSATYRALRVLLFRFGDVAGLLNLRPARFDAPAAVGLDEMANAIVEVNALAKQDGFSFVVLNNDLDGTDAKQGLREGAELAHVPFLDMAGMLEQKREERDLEVAARLGLMPTTVPTPTSEFVFRVLVSGHPTRVLVSHHRFLDSKTVTEDLHDDGTHGDEHAGDGVWSLRTSYRPGDWVLYSYSAAEEGKTPTHEWQDSFLINGYPALGPVNHSLRIKPGVPAIETYGQWYLHSDGAHPDAEGQALIAAQLRDAILALPNVREALGRS
jgi:lysophospholipase L1-like esterase